MSATAQLILVGVMVAAATAYIVRAAWKTWTAKFACGSSCGKCATPTPEPKPEGRFPLPQV